MCCNLLGVAHEFDYTRVTFDLVNCAVEVGDLAIRGEDVRPEEISYTALEEVQCWSMPLVCAVAKTTYSEDEADKDHAKVEALLRRSRRLLSHRELCPRYMSIVVERCHCSSLRFGALRRCP